MTSFQSATNRPGAAKLTKGCQKVLEILKHSHDLTSAQDIHGRLRTDGENPPGLTTVYRSLQSLVELGLVQSVDLGDGEKRYELVKPGEHHHHLVCEQCGASVHLDQCLVEELEEAVRKTYGFEIRSHVLELFGACRNCLSAGAHAGDGAHKSDGAHSGHDAHSGDCDK